MRRSKNLNHHHLYVKYALCYRPAPQWESDIQTVPEPAVETPGEVVPAIPSPRISARNRLRCENPVGLLVTDGDCDGDPRSYREALDSSLDRQWRKAMQEEYASLKENDTFTPVADTHGY